MRRSSHDISFTLWGFPTVIQPYFWFLATLLMAFSLGKIESMPIWTAHLLCGIVAIVISVLTHELGHALTFRYLFRTHCSIVLHGLGGAAIPMRHHQRSYGFRGMTAECFLSFSGPLAGFLLALVCLILLQVIPDDDRFLPSLFLFFLWWTAMISIIWGIFNLLPIYPMDGGHISRELFVFISPRRGIEYSLILSMMFAALLAVVALRFGMFIATFFFAYFAYQNYQEMSYRSFR